MMGQHIDGIPELLTERGVKVYVNKEEASWVSQTIGLETSDMVAVDGETEISIGKVPLRFIHTPGHTPGSQCFLVEEEGQPGRLVSGDTLFLGSCGRVDLPGSAPEAMYRSLNETLVRLPDDTIVFPGHLYGDPQGSLGEQKRTNPLMRVSGLEQFLSFMGV